MCLCQWRWHCRAAAQCDIVHATVREKRIRRRGFHENLAMFQMTASTETYLQCAPAAAHSSSMKEAGRVGTQGLSHINKSCEPPSTAKVC